MTKRIFALLLAVLMLFTVVGCKDNPEDTSGSLEVEYEYEYLYEDADGDGEPDASTDGTGSDGTDDGTSGGDDTPTADRKLEGNTYTTGFPIVKKKETIKIMCTTRADLGDFSSGDFDKVLEEKMGIQIDWDLVTESAVAQRKTLALQSGDLPDIMAWGLDDEQMLTYSSEGAIHEIKKSELQKWAPNIVDTYNAYPDTWKLTKATDGKMYSLSGLTKDFQWSQHYVYIRKTWLNKLGLAVPKTMDDFYEVLKAFRDKDPNGNGQKDEVPYATWNRGGFFSYGWGFGGNIMVNNKGKVIHTYTLDEFKDYLTYWNKVYKEDLVDKGTIENWAGNNAAFKTLIGSGKVGAFYYGWPAEAMDEKLAGEYVCLPWPDAPNDSSLPAQFVDVYPVVNRGSFTISAKTKNYTAVLRFLDYLYTDDAYMLKMYGKEGVAYKKTSDTTYELTGKTNTSKNPGWAIRGRHFLENSKITNWKVSTYDALRVDIDNWCASTYKSSGQKILPTAYMTKNEVKQLKLYSTYFNGITSAYDFIKGNKSISTDLTALRNEMKTKGLDKYLKVYQDYYDRVNK